MLTLDEVIEQIKPFGPYQKFLYFLLCSTSIPAGIHIMVTVFIMAVPEHRCAIPGLDNDTYQIQGAWHKELLNMTIPYNKEDGTWSQCSYYTHRNMTNPSVSRNETSTCSKWVYSKEYFEQTIVSELNLVCDDKNKVALANSVLMGGLLAGSIVLGFLSDVIGRKKIVLGSLIGLFVVTFATGFVSSYAVVVILRFFTTFCVAGFMLSAFVIGMELVGPAQRTVVGILIPMNWCTGLSIILLLAYFLRNWHHLQIAVSCTSLIFIPLFYLIPESVRWLASRGRLEEASVIIRKAAKVNKADVSEKVLSLQDLQSDEGPQEKVWHLFTCPRLLMRCLIIFFNWMVVSMTYYGLGLNVGSLSGNIFLNFMYSIIAELLSYVFCMACMQRIGRRPFHCFNMLLGGGACVAVVFPVLYGNDSNQWVTIALSMLGKFGISAAFGIIYIFSAELFPTMVRNSGIGVSSMCARIGGIASPYIATLSQLVTGHFAIALPSLVFGALSILAGICALFLPETLNRQLPETIEDAKQFGKTSRNKKCSYSLETIPSDGKKNDDGTPTRH